jgi:hypothetical protein
VVDAIFFRPLAFPNPDCLIMVTTEERYRGAHGIDTGQDCLAWELIRDHLTLFEPAVFERGMNGGNLAAAGHAEYL